MRTLGKVIFSAGALALLTTCARAEGTAPPPATPVAQPGVSVSITQQDGANLTQVCNIAIDGAKDLGTKTGIGQFCLGLLGKIGEAQRNAAKSVAPVSTPSTSPAKSGEKK
jgi:hypothetical protein